MRSALLARSSERSLIAVRIIRWGSFYELPKHGSTFTIRSGLMRGSRIFLRSNMLNNITYKIFLILPYRTVYFIGDLTGHA
jgi:hypothetical protein